MRQLVRIRWAACGPGTKLCCSAQSCGLGLINIMLSPPKLSSHSSATIQHTSLWGHSVLSIWATMWAFYFQGSWLSPRHLKAPSHVVESTHKLSLKAAMRWPSTTIRIKWQLWQSSGKARNRQRNSKACDPSAPMEQHTWPSPDSGSWQERWGCPAWRTGVFPGQSVLPRGKEGPAAEGSLDRHPGGTLGQRPDEE